MAYWLVKSEPFKYSWDQLVNDKITTWDGVRNYAARNNIREMKKGDEVFFYHSNEGMEIVGVAKIVKEAYQDASTDNKSWLAVDIRPFKKLKKPISLVRIKAAKQLADMDLVRLGRLSVQVVKKAEWEMIMDMANEK